MYDEHGQKTDGLDFSFEWLFKIAAAGMAMVLVIVGLVMAYGIFTLVRDTLLDPNRFTEFIVAWSEPIAEDEPAPQAEPGDDVATVPEPANEVAETETNPEADTPAEPGPAAEAPEESTSDPPAPPEQPVQVPAPNPPDGGSPQQFDSGKAEVLDTIDRFLDVVREGDLGRAAGGFIIFLFLYILAKIALGILKTGGDFLIAFAAARDRKSGSLTSDTNPL